MALRLQLAKRFLSDSNLMTKLVTPFSTSSILKSELDDVIRTKGDVIAVNPEEKQTLHTEQRKIDDSLIVEEEYIVSHVNGVPEEHITERLARIAKAPKNAMQSGTSNSQGWILQFDNRERWENNLMGWVSSGDPLSNLQLRFNNPEEAIAFCKKHRYPYFVEKEKPVAPKNKSYAVNFSWNKRTRASTK